MTPHVTEIERVRSRRTDWRSVAAAKLKRQTKEALSQLDLVKEAQAARRKLIEKQRNRDV